LISLSRGVFALYKLGRPKIRRIKRLKLAWSRHWPVCPWPLKLSSGTLWVKSKAPVLKSHYFHALPEIGQSRYGLFIF
jgi:hypothetical protein